MIIALHQYWHNTNNTFITVICIAEISPRRISTQCFLALTKSTPVDLSDSDTDRMVQIKVIFIYWQNGANKGDFHLCKKTKKYYGTVVCWWIVVKMEP